MIGLDDYRGKSWNAQRESEEDDQWLQITEDFTWNGHWTRTLYCKLGNPAFTFKPSFLYKSRPIQLKTFEPM